jgi:WD40 repeat protein
MLAVHLPIDGVCDLVRDYVGFQGVCVRDERSCGECVNDVKILPNGKIACARNRVIRIWNGSECESLLEGHTDYVICLAFCSQLASGSRDFTVRLWGSGAVLKGHQGAVTSLAFLDADRLASGSWDYTVRIWDVVHNECLQVLDGHTGGVSALVVLRNGLLVSGSNDMTVRIWDKHLSIRRGHRDWIMALAVLEDGTLVSGGLDRTIYRWRDGLCINIIETMRFGVVVALASLPGNLMACGFHDDLVVFDAIGTIMFQTCGVNVRALSVYKNKLVVGTRTGGIQMWE